ncbi:MAG TPA: hypothetical protein VGW33_11150 [Terriglobia bacterium]|nr:hypothetical protein [Terriglobia bacterium]
MKLRKMAAGLALAAFAMMGSGGAGVQGQAAGVKASSPSSQAAQYCRSTGGMSLVGIPYYGTNGGIPLQLAGQSSFCQYTAMDGSQATLLLSTLVATLPSLAATAYYAQVPAGSCNGNPLSCYCTLLGGSDQFGGTTGAGGGWVFDGNFNNVLEACIFPDQSSIDSGVLFYHSAGIIRGIDLSTVLRYKNP